MDLNHEMEDYVGCWDPPSSPRPAYLVPRLSYILLTSLIAKWFLSSNVFLPKVYRRVRMCCKLQVSAAPWSLLMIVLQ